MVGATEPLAVILSGTVHMRLGSGLQAKLRAGSALNYSGLLELPEVGDGQRSAMSEAHLTRAGEGLDDDPHEDQVDVITLLCPHSLARASSPDRRARTPTVGLPITAWAAADLPKVMFVSRADLSEILGGGAGPRLMANIRSIEMSCKTLCDHRVFTDMPAEAAFFLAMVSTRHAMEAGAVLVTQGEVGDIAESLIVIEEGEAAVEELRPCHSKAASAQTVGSLGAGAVVGDACFVGSKVPRAATLRASTDMKVLRISPQGLVKVLSIFPGLIQCMKPRLLETANMLLPSLPPHTDVLATLPLFTGCKLSFVRAVASVAERRSFYCGHVVHGRGTDSVLHVVEFGTCVSATTMETWTQDIGATLSQDELMGIGSCIGASSFVSQTTPKHQEAAVHVATPLAIILVVSRVSFRTVLERYPEERNRFEYLAQHLPEVPQRGHDVANLPLFRSCSAAFTAEVASVVELRYYMPGQIAAVEGAADSASMFVITGGAMDISVQGQHVKELSVGAIFGEFAMLGLVRRRTATARAVTLCSMMEIAREKFLSVLERHPQVREHFEQIVTVGDSNASSPQARWSIFEGVPSNLLYLVNLYAERQVLSASAKSLGSGSLQMEEGAAVLVMRGALKLMSESGKELVVFNEGACFNEHALLGLRPLEGKLVAAEGGEVQIITKNTFDKILAEFPQFRDRVVRGILREVAAKAERQLGFAPGTPQVLATSPPLRALPDAAWDPVRLCLEEVVYDTGEVITEEGAEGDTMFILLQGNVTIETGGTSRLRTSSDRFVFGEAVVLGVDQCYSVTVRATDMCVVLALGRPELLETLSEIPAALRMITDLQKLASRRSGSVVDQLLQTNSSAPNSYLSHACAACPEFVVKMCEDAEHVFFAPDDVIIGFGEACAVGKTHCYIMQSGGAIVQDEFAMQMATLAPGDVFGEAGALGFAERRTTTVRAAPGRITHCSRLHPKSMGAAIEAFPQQIQELQELARARQTSNTDLEEHKKHFMQTSVIPALTANPVLAALPEHMLEKLILPLPEQQFDPGELIASTGETAGSIIYFTSGEARVEDKKGAVVGQVHAGAVIGELSLMGLLGFRSSTLRASRSCRVIRIPNQTLQELLEKEPEAAEARQQLSTLREVRLRQVLESLPFSALPIGLTDGSVCARSVCLHAERVDVGPGVILWPQPDTCPTGPHFSVIAQGNAKVVVGEAERLAMTVSAGQLLPDGILAQFSAYTVALVHCEVYRICQSDFLLAVSSSPESQKRKCLSRFEEAFGEACSRVRGRLRNAHGALKMKEKRMASELVVPARKHDPWFGRLIERGPSDPLMGKGLTTASSMPILPGVMGDTRDRLQAKILYEVSTGLVALKDTPNFSGKGLGVLQGGQRFFGTAHQVGEKEWLQIQRAPSAPSSSSPLFSPLRPRSTVPPLYHSIADLSSASKVWVHQDGTCLPVRRAREDDGLDSTTDTAFRQLRKGNLPLKPLETASPLRALFSQDDLLRKTSPWKRLSSSKGIRTKTS